jgi:hypothetical protein
VPVTRHLWDDPESCEEYGYGLGAPDGILVLKYLYALRQPQRWDVVVFKNPENPEIWKSMYQIYSHLNMEEEAEAARTKANANRQSPDR